MPIDTQTLPDHHYELGHLKALEAESIHIIREVAATMERPLLLFSGGKDSIVMLRLAEKAFWPAKIPFPVMHVDTGENFPEVLAYRDHRVAELGINLIVASVQEDIDAGRSVEIAGAGRNRLQTVTLLRGIEEGGYTAVFGGARRDEEKARAKERVFSFRDDFGQWDPKNQRPELWSLYNGRHRPGEHIRVFPLSNWTELDIWQYIADESIEIPSIYYAHKRPVVRRAGMLMAINEFVAAQEELELPGIYMAHEREVFERDGMLYAISPFITLIDGEEPFTASVRYRTVGDMSCTGAVRSTAGTLPDVVAEIAATDVTERGETRADDR
ncbi:MAG: sulfate adenylyltransferase subunit CysD, partial [Acidimicrobiales bacterium]|nr:sulfate adenylyltransferase subunit CysD [Acidimicrobiales bacterium]